MDFILGGQIFILLILEFAVINLSRQGWKERRNPIDFATFLISIFTLLDVLYDVYHFIIVEFNLLNGQHFNVIGDVNLGEIFRFVVLSLYLWLILYVMEWKRFYLFPTMGVFFIILIGVALDDYNLMAYAAFVAIVIGDIFLVRNAVKNNHGLSFALALLSIFYIIPQLFSLDYEYYNLMFYTLRWLAQIILLLGINGWLDDKIFFDRKKAKAIKNTWISSMVEHEETDLILAPKELSINCPYCQQTTTVQIPSEIIRMRSANTLGIAEHIISDTKCGHAVTIYIDRAFAMFGYKPIPQT